MVEGEGKKMRDKWAWRYCARDIAHKKFNKKGKEKQGKRMSHRLQKIREKKNKEKR